MNKIPMSTKSKRIERVWCILTSEKEVLGIVTNKYTVSYFILQDIKPLQLILIEVPGPCCIDKFLV
ncbi:hypothetical protein SDC9_63893 [bioreactor metagenome]|uniref:Uncharacterized protein n=1 Tax=bioreactor metagenome TaxID=1076179 RepID=A0A644XP17_9ZZZZ